MFLSITGNCDLMGFDIEANRCLHYYLEKISFDDSVTAIMNNKGVDGALY